MHKSVTINRLGISLLLAFALLQGCKKQVIDVRQTQVIQGLIYKLHDKEPFTGQINNMAGNYFADLAKLNYSGLTSKHFGALWPRFNTNQASCIVNVVNGIVDGSADCVKDGQIVYKGTFVNGLKQGSEEFIATLRKRSPIDRERPIHYKNNWDKGLRRGIEEIYILPNQILIEQINWKNGRKEGEEKHWTADGKLLLVDLNWADGQKTGFERSLDDGDQTCTYQNGQEIQCIKKVYNIVKDENGNFDLNNYKTFLYSVSTKDNINSSNIYEEYNQLGKLIYKKSFISEPNGTRYRQIIHKWNWNNTILRQETITNTVSNLGLSTEGESDHREIIYYDETGQLAYKEFYENGHLTKKEQQQVPDLAETTSANKVISVKDTSQTVATCIDNTIKSIRDEIGDEPIITVDQLTEIENNCQNGSAPTQN